jgi:ribosomal protein L11 methyltransferase
VTVPAAHAEAVGSFLLDLGSPGLVSDDASDAVTLTAYLAAEPAEQLAALRAFCADLAGGEPALPPARIQTRPLRPEDWAHNWMEHFPPLAIGQRLFVVPPWITDLPPDRVPIVIDPGLAFGTGQHATTQSCLVLIERAVAARRVVRALDVGTGSGILAIALAKLGVSDVWGIDHDPEACRAARANCARNGVADRVRISDALQAVAEPFELIVANLLSSLLIDMAPTLTELVARDGELIASGILTSEAPALATAFQSHHLREHDRVVAGEWTTLAFRAEA